MNLHVASNKNRKPWAVIRTCGNYITALGMCGVLPPLISNEMPLAVPYMYNTHAEHMPDHISKEARITSLYTRGC